jgi:methyl-accepting chemotaxis protein
LQRASEQQASAAEEISKNIEAISNVTHDVSYRSSTDGKSERRT